MSPNMSRTSTSIELQGYPQTPQTIMQPPSVYQKDDDGLLTTDDLQPINAPKNAVTAEILGEPDKKTTAIVLLTVVCVTMISSMLSGVVAVALPSIAKDLELGPDVLLWYGKHVLLPTDMCSQDPGQSRSMPSRAVARCCC